MKLVWVRPGKATLGDVNGVLDDTEFPPREIQITKPFYMSSTEVTQKQWNQVMPHNPSKWKGDDLPVEGVTWHDAQQFAKRLGEIERNCYRLPSGDEWEYACRAGTSTDFYFGNKQAVRHRLGDYAWHTMNSDGRPHPVAGKPPNPWQLYDMLGNVGEWCVSSSDQPPEQPVRGGSADPFHHPHVPWQLVLLPFFEVSWDAQGSSPFVGFRVIMEPTEPGGSGVLVHRSFWASND